MGQPQPFAGLYACVAGADVHPRCDTPRYIYFTADRPFVYAIVERATRTVLFLGHVVNL